MLKMKRPKAWQLLTSCLMVSGVALAVTSYPPATDIPFTKDLGGLKASLPLPVTDEVEKLTIPLRKVKTRILNPKKDPTIEPISISVPRSETGLRETAERLASPGRTSALRELLLKKMKKAGPSNRDSVKIDLESEDMRYFSLKALAKEMSREHHKVTVPTKDWDKDPQVWNEFRTQLSFMLSKEQLSRVSKKVRSGSDLILDDDLLPSFSKKMVGKYIIYKGPNCFHSSLSFFDQQLPRSPDINIKEEEGYHKAMINYDELWRVISNQFYEVDPRVGPLKYGDLLVFFQLPEGSSKNINFKWIRHTAIYLFGPYTFSKGSKSPNTPYSVKTVNEEWSTWQSMVQNLGLKVYRRQIPTADGKVPMQQRDDWIY